MIRCWLAIAVLALSCFRPESASAQADDFASARFEWIAPSECIDAAALEQAVSLRMRRPAFIASENADLVVRGRVEPSPNGLYRVTLELTTRDGESLGVRELESDNDDCRSLDDAVAVMLAILLNVRHADVPPPRVPEWSWGARAGAGLVIGLLPQPGIETVIGAGVIYAGAFGIELELAYDWADTVRVAPDGSVRVNAAFARVLVTPILLAGDVEIALRLAVGAGPMWGRGSGFAIVSSDVRFVLEARAGLRLAVRLAGPLFLEIAADFGLLPVRPSFAVRNADDTLTTVFEPTIALGAFTAGFSLRP